MKRFADLNHSSFDEVDDILGAKNYHELLELEELDEINIYFGSCNLEDFNEIANEIEGLIYHYRFLFFDNWYLILN